MTRVLFSLLSQIVYVGEKSRKNDLKKKSRLLDQISLWILIACNISKTMSQTCLTLCLSWWSHLSTGDALKPRFIVDKEISKFFRRLIIGRNDTPTNLRPSPTPELNCRTFCQNNIDFSLDTIRFFAQLVVVFYQIFMKKKRVWVVTWF